MTIKLTDELIDEIREHLASDLPTRITAVNAAFADAITLANFDAVRVDDPETGVRTQMIAATLHVVATVGSIGHWNQSVAHTTQDVVLWVTARDQDKQVLRRKLYRYLLAVWNSLVAGHYSGEIPWSMGIDIEPQFDYSETFTRDNVMYADARLVIRFATMEA